MWSHIVRNDNIKTPPRTPPVCVYFLRLSSVNADLTSLRFNLPSAASYSDSLSSFSNPFLTLQSDIISQVPQIQSSRTHLQLHLSLPSLLMAL